MTTPAATRARVLSLQRRHRLQHNAPITAVCRSASSGKQQQPSAATPADTEQLTSEPVVLDQSSPFYQPALTQEDLQVVPEEHRSGYIALIGRPNAGKSTLMNAMVGQKLSIVTAKPQTTRHRILGIVSTDAYQLVLFDTPGVIKGKHTKLEDRMMSFVKMAVNQCDALLSVVDAVDDPKAVLEMIQLPPDWKGPPMSVVLNKVDLVSEDDAAALSQWYKSNCRCENVFVVSALNGMGVAAVQEWAASQIPVGPILYPKDMVSEHPERFFVAEIIRERIFEQYQQEVPYCVQVNVVEFKERAKGKDYVGVQILCEKEGQKGIIVGKAGAALKQLATSARTEIEAFLGREVYLDIKVKVSPNWRSDAKLLQQYGY